MSQKIGQKQAVIAAVQAVMGTNFTPCATKVKELLTSDQLLSVREQVFKGIASGEVSYDKPVEEKVLRRYVNGMIDNHMRKAKELNGGSKYAPTAARGPRRDASLTALNTLLQQYPEGTEEREKINAAIAKRESELAEQKSVKTSKKKDVRTEIDMSLLDDDIAALLN